MAGRISHETVAEHIKGRIRSGTLKRGDRLPSFSQLHRQLGAARATVSKALGTLAIDGLVERRSGSGVYVAHTAPLKRKTRIAVAGPMPRMFDSDYWTRLFVGIQSAAHSFGVEVAFTPTLDDLHWDEYNGLLVFDADARFALNRRPAGVPVVAMGVPSFGMPSVSLSDYDAGFMATKYLVELGHRNIAFLGFTSTPTICFRLAGYYAARWTVPPDSSDGLRGYFSTFSTIAPPCDDRLVRGLGFSVSGRPGYIGDVAIDSTSVGACVSSTGTTSHAYDNMAQWFADGFEQLNCTAIIAQNDFYAEGIMAFLHGRGYRVPEDISVIGFDNERICAQMTPPLTSVGGDMADVGETAMKAILRAIDGEEIASMTLPVHLSVRESTGPAPTRTSQQGK